MNMGNRISMRRRTAGLAVLGSGLVLSVAALPASGEDTGQDAERRRLRLIGEYIAHFNATFPVGGLDRMMTQWAADLPR